MNHSDYPKNEQQMYYQQEMLQQQSEGFEQFTPPQRTQSAQEIHFVSFAPFEDKHFVAALSYSLCWFTGLLFLLFAGNNRFVRFHALQSLIFFGGINVIDIVLIRIGMISFHHHYMMPPALAFLALMLINFIAFLGWIIGMIQAARGTYYKLPIAGNIAASCVKGPYIH